MDEDELGKDALFLNDTKTSDSSKFEFMFKPTRSRCYSFLRSDKLLYNSKQTRDLHKNNMLRTFFIVLLLGIIQIAISTHIHDFDGLFDLERFRRGASSSLKFPNYMTKTRIPGSHKRMLVIPASSHPDESIQFDNHNIDMVRHVLEYADYGILTDVGRFFG